MIRLGIGALVVAGILGYITYVEATLAFQSSAQAETISLKQLIARGPEGNAHINLTNFVLCDNLVYQVNDKNKDVWTNVWIPVVPSDEVNPAAKEPIKPSNVKALFFSINIRNHQELENRLNRPAVQALVTNRITSLESKIRTLLQQQYPETDFNNCLIIQEGRSPANQIVVYLLGVGTVVALLAACGLFFAGSRSRR